MSAAAPVGRIVEAAGPDAATREARLGQRQGVAGIGHRPAGAHQRVAKVAAARRAGGEDAPVAVMSGRRAGRRRAADSGGEKGAAWTTATGHAVGLGIVAADPKTFPYHSRMFIQSYGMGQVEDTGGMKGNVIDVWFPSYSDCVSWGRRNVTVWLLD